MSDVPWGVLLSGGLDSSLVASIATRFMKGNSKFDKEYDSRSAHRSIFSIFFTALSCSSTAPSPLLHPSGTTCIHLHSPLHHILPSTTLEKNSEEKFFPRLHSFCVGLPDSPDLAAAAKVAASLGTIHHSYTYTIQEVTTPLLHCT